MPSQKELDRVFGNAEPGNRINVLIVADGRLGFNNDRGSYNLGYFCNALREGSDVAQFNITTAYRNQNGEGFRFISYEQLESYHEIWLFGDNREIMPMTDSELDVIIEYMDSGGGIVAVGDHENIGYALCGRIPRVGSMRKWNYDEAYPNDSAPGIIEGRHDTVVHDPGYDIVGDDFLTSQRESDSMPKRIYPDLITLKPFVGSKERMVVHQIFSTKDGIINILPDHMHEGECIAGQTFTKTYGSYGYRGKYSGRREYPLSYDGRLERPHVIARALSIAQPKLFGCASAYDGHNVYLQKGSIENRPGRIVTVSTWHHFVDGNINGLADKPDSKDYEMIKHYYKNIAEWVAHHSVQREMMEHAFAKAATYHPLKDIIESASIPTEAKIRVLVNKAYDALRMLATEEQLTDWAIKSYNAKIPEHQVYLQAWSEEGSETGIHLETAFGVYLFSKASVSAKVIQKTAGLMPASLSTLLFSDNNTFIADNITEETKLIKRITDILCRDVENLSSKMTKIVNQLPR